MFSRTTLFLPRMNCLFCQQPLTHQILDLGHSPLANGYLTAAELNQKEAFYPLKLYRCTHCQLVQLSDHADTSDIFNDRYAYLSASSGSWRAHCQAYVEAIVPQLNLGPNSQVVELGSNDGTLLKHFQAFNVPALGIDPATISSQKAIDEGLQVSTAFFTAELAAELRQEGIAADLIVGNNVLAHVPKINNFVAGIALLLKPGGTCTLEVPYLPNLLAYNEFDTVYHEHFFYFSLTALQRIMAAHALHISDAVQINIHCGSIRIFVNHNQHTNTSTAGLQALLAKEIQMGVDTKAFYAALQQKALAIKTGFLQWLHQQLALGKSIVCYGAAAKGNTFLNYCGITNTHIKYIADVTPPKQGLYLPGSHILIVPEEKLLELKPDYIVVLPWNFRNEINERLKFTRAWGAQLVYFIPEFEVVAP